MFRTKILKQFHDFLRLGRGFRSGVYAGIRWKAVNPVMAKDSSSGHLDSRCQPKVYPARSSGDLSDRCQPRVYPARSWFVPGKSKESLQRASNVGADVLFLDMEDSVPLTQKPTIRDLYLDALNKNMFSGLNVYIRLNEIAALGEVIADVNAFTTHDVSGFLLPKVRTVSDLQTYNTLVMEHEQKANIMGHIKFVPIIETPDAFFNLDSIAGGCQRNVALLSGTADFSSEALCAESSGTTDALNADCVIAARKNKLEPIAGAYLKIDDHIGFEHFCGAMKRKGYIGCVTLTPDQSNIAHAVFGFSDEDIKWAKAVTHAIESKTHGVSVATLQQTVQHSREFVGPPHHNLAVESLQRHDLLTAASTKSHTMPTPTIIPVLSKGRGLLDSVEVGRVISGCSQITFSEGIKLLWDASFFNFMNTEDSHHRSTVTPNKLPIGLLVSICAGMSVASFSEPARVHLGFYDVFQHRPILYGDVLRSEVVIDEAFSTKDKYTIVGSTHTMLNKGNEIVFSLKKRTMFAKLEIKNTDKNADDSNVLTPEHSPLRWNVLNTTSQTCTKSLHQLSSLYNKGSVTVHGTVKHFSDSETTMLMRLMRFNNNHHFRRQCYKATDILVGGPLIVGAMLSNFYKDLPNIIYEDILECTNINKVILGESLTTLTYLVDLKPEVDSSQYHELTLKHLAVKNTDPEVLAEMELPLRLFSDRSLNKPKCYEKVCLESCPSLYRKIACQAIHRVIVSPPH